MEEITKQVSTLIKRKLKDNNIKLGEAAKFIGIGSAQAISNKLSRGTIRSNEERALASSMGYHVEWIANDLKAPSKNEIDARLRHLTSELAKRMQQSVQTYKLFRSAFNGKDTFTKEDLLLAEKANLAYQDVLVLWKEIQVLCHTIYTEEMASSVLNQIQSDIKKQSGHKALSLDIHNIPLFSKI